MVDEWAAAREDCDTTSMARSDVMLLPAVTSSVDTTRALSSPPVASKMRGPTSVYRPSVSVRAGVGSIPLIPLTGNSDRQAVDAGRMWSEGEEGRRKCAAAAAAAAA